MENAPGNQWEELAHRTWLAVTPKKADQDFLRSQLWIPLEAEGFSARSLLPLDNLQILEKYLWPTFSENASNQHVILIAAFVGVKQQSNLPPWSIFANHPAEFSNLFQRILSLCLDQSIAIRSRLLVLDFVAAAFQSLEKDIVRKECAPLVSISTWHNLHSESYREKELQKSTGRQKAWRSAKKKFESTDKATQVKLQFDRAWLYSATLDFLTRVSVNQATSSEEVAYCEHYLEFLIDLISQLPTRRYAIVLLKDLNVLPILRNSEMLRKNEYATLNDLTELYQHFADLSVDESSTLATSSLGNHEHYQALSFLQRTAFQHFEEKLKVFALSNYASIDSPSEISAHLSSLTDAELETLCGLLDVRTKYPTNSEIVRGSSFFLQAIASAYCRTTDYRERVRQNAIAPTEQSLYDPALLRNETYNGSKPLALPKLNLQYLSLDDFMWRSFQLHQAEAFYDIRNYMENVVRRMKPRLSRDARTTEFEGFSKMAMPIEKPAIIEVGQPKVGSITPSFVRAEVLLEVSRLNDRIISEWDSLRPKDTVFLLAVRGKDSGKLISNGVSANGSADESKISILRTAEVVQVLDDKGKPLRDTQNGTLFTGRNRKRRLLLDLDPVAYHHDQERLSQGNTDMWHTVNLIVRRQGRENNFKPVLETIQRLVGSDAHLSSWLQDVYLGFGDPKSATYPNIADQVTKVDFLDTFLDWNHLLQSFPKQKLIASDDSNGLQPPFVLDLSKAQEKTTLTNPKKRRRDQMEGEEALAATFHVSTYKPPNTGPYPSDVPKRNAIRFTPTQVSAILSGVQPGLSLIVGPPGTGKTDVATQIINILYHNFPSERILLVAHSNQALNQLFQKITALDIDPRHLLRLGHGEEELDTEISYSKAGRVDSFMENRQTFLAEVNRLASSIGATGAHGSTCETADYFNQVFIQPAWARFWSVVNAVDVTQDAIIHSFPFKKFFSNAPVPELFPTSATIDEMKEIAQGCNHHLNKLFTELESIRAFEILRTPRDQANHLLVKEARIIAMTSTHAAMRRSEIADLGFRYDSLVMEEAAQINEIESFVPCAMQNPDAKTGEMTLKRVVLVGDHLQNSPIVQNLALRQFANFEQSLFLRFVRLGVPFITLDQQGRCRPSIAELFDWRYDNLSTLPHLASLPDFQTANAGFAHEYQFIDVPDYQGEGEREPTPHFIQNLGEAEYAVALFQYMRLLGYPAKSISILATYAGQKSLIKDVLDHRCKTNRLFGLPRTVTTVDKYQGEQNEYVILSLVRTKNVGYLRDVRRLTVALSRARLGLYVLGRRDLFENCFEMKTAIERLNKRGGPEGKLELVTGEMFPTSRRIGDQVASVQMDGVEHLGQYVYEMTQAKIKSLGGIANIAAADAGTAGDEVDEADAELGEEAELDEDPLHEVV